MRLSQVVNCIHGPVFAFYRLVKKLIINAHQLYAHWRTRVKNQYCTSGSSSEPSVELTQIRRATNLDQLEQQSSTEQAHNKPSLSNKTPKPSRAKLQSLFRRLSLRNFMEFCVTALNEASSSTCSNKFDLSSCESHVWLLGKQYELPQDSEKLSDDIRSKLWITYRRNFPPIDENARYTTDRGFGCMIRCGQMVLANALLNKNLGRDWRWSPQGLESNPDVYNRILRLFQDKDESTYSIHNIVRVGQQEGKVVGEWFGPNTIAQALKRIACTQSQGSSINPTYQNEAMISIDAALDNIVVVDEIKSKFMIENLSINLNNGRDPTSSSNMPTFSEWLPGILFIQLRLGLTKINPLYFEGLRKTFHLKNSLGIIGGRPNHALYLIGYIEDDIIYLDPHSTQQYVDFDSREAEANLSDCSAAIDSSYHCVGPEKMPLDRLDPSLALCFYFHTEEDFDEWCEFSERLLIKSEKAPMFEIAKSRPPGWKLSTAETNQELHKSCPTNTNADRRNSKIKRACEEAEKFTSLMEPSDYDTTEDSESKTAHEHTPDNNSQTNDDDEFEMLG